MFPEAYLAMIMSELNVRYYKHNYQYVRYCHRSFLHVTRFLI